VQTKTKVRIFRSIGAVTAAAGITLLVRWLLYPEGHIFTALLCLFLSIMYIFTIPREFMRAGREEAKLKAKREEEARRDRERFERVKREEREWIEKRKGNLPG